jgi:hypothetical protein
MSAHPLLTAAVVLTLLGAAPAVAGEPATFQLQDPEIRESSGVAVSARRERVIFTHNDSGDVPRFFAVDDRGCTVARYALKGAEAVDWEDMSRGADHRGKPTLWFGDIGDNAAERIGITVYRVTEPKLPKEELTSDACPAPADKGVAATRFDLEYADGAHDAEALLVHVRTGRVYVATKGESSQLYAAPRRLRTGEVNVLEPVAPLEARVGLVTAGDFSPDGRRLVLRNYGEAFEWRIRNGDIAAALANEPEVIPLPPTPQGEAIAYTADGDVFITTTEDPAGAGAPVYRVPR